MPIANAGNIIINQADVIAEARAYAIKNPDTLRGIRAKLVVTAATAVEKYASGEFHPTAGEGRAKWEEELERTCRAFAATREQGMVRI